MIAAIIVVIVAPYLLPLVGLTGLPAAIVTGMLAGGIATGTWKGALLGGLAAGIGFAAGRLASSLAEPGSVAHAMVRAVAGCATSAIGGGSCGRGTLAAGFADYSSGQLQMAQASQPGANFLDAVHKGAEAVSTTTLDGGTFGEEFREAQQAIIGFVRDHVGGDGGGAKQGRKQTEALAVNQSDRERCLQDNYGALYDAAFELSPFSLVSVATDEITEVLEDELSRQANRNLYSMAPNVSQRIYEVGKRQAKLLTQFRRFNAAVAVAGVDAGGFVFGANLYCVSASF